MQHVLPVRPVRVDLVEFFGVKNSVGGVEVGVVAFAFILLVGVGVDVVGVGAVFALRHR